MKLEEYILKRKKEDGINELDLNKKTENTQICVNYVFEYFNNYLDSSTGENSTLLHNEKLDKYRHILIDYMPEIQDWLVSLYSSYGKHMHRQIDKYITDPFYLLYTTDSEFRSLSYDLYSSLIKKFKFLENQSEMLFLFLKDHQRVKNLFHEYDKNVFISADINAWIQSTYKEYDVNLLNFANDYIGGFAATPELWPKGHSFVDKKKRILL